MSRLIHTARRALCALALAAPFALPFTAASAQTIQVDSVDRAGCVDTGAGRLQMTITWADLAASQIIRTVVTVDGQVYMNEQVDVGSSPINPLTGGSMTWGLYDLFDYGAVPNQGTWPIPDDARRDKSRKNRAIKH